MKVLKFGEARSPTAVASSAVTAIVAEAARGDRVAVVLSAMKGVTDLLISAARKAEEGSEGTKDALEAIRALHFDAVRVLFGPADQASALTPLAIMCNELEEILHGVELIRECSARTMDLVMSFGERLSCRLGGELHVREGDARRARRRAGDRAHRRAVRVRHRGLPDELPAHQREARWHATGSP